MEFVDNLLLLNEQSEIIKNILCDGCNRLINEIYLEYNSNLSETNKTTYELIYIFPYFINSILFKLDFNLKNNEKNEIIKSDDVKIKY